MTEQKKSFMTQYVIAGAVGLAFIGYQTQAKNNANAVGNLPATNANVAANAQAIIDDRDRFNGELASLRDQLTAAIKEAEDDAEADLDAEAQLIRSEINRREVEMVKYVDTLDNKIYVRVNGIEGRLERDEDMLIDHMNTPPAAHGRGD